MRLAGAGRARKPRDAAYGGARKCAQMLDRLEVAAHEEARKNGAILQGNTEG
jgi:hypothetical protein